MTAAQGTVTAPMTAAATQSLANYRSKSNCTRSIRKYIY